MLNTSEESAKEENASTSMIEKKEWITDDEAKFILAKIYSSHPETYEEAWHLYQSLLNEPMQKDENWVFEFKTPSSEEEKKKP